jgi:putative transposase
VQARLEDAAQCLLVIIGATPEGKKERESAQSWKELLLDLKRRGLAIGPELAVADGALNWRSKGRAECPDTGTHDRVWSRAPDRPCGR